MRTISRPWSVAAALFCAARLLAAQGAPPPALGDAFELERLGRYAEAAQRFRAALAADATSLPALLGLERVLSPLGQLDSLIPPVNAALARQPGNRVVHAIELRAWAALGPPDSVRAAVRRWMAVDSATVIIYRDWAYAVAQRGNLPEARRVLEEGSERVAGDALLQDLAQMAGLAGAWPDAARYWRRAAVRNGDLALAGAMNLERAPITAHDDVIEALLHPPADTAGRRLAADLLVGWERAGEAWPLLDATLPATVPQAVPLLQRFADRAAVSHSREGLRARGFALERLGNLLTGLAAARARVQAARAFADAGDQGAAERVLERVATDGSGDPATASSAMATLISVMARSGRAREAEERFTQWASRMPGDQVAALRLQVARAWLDEGSPDRAIGVLATDSSGEAMGLRGWVALYRGDVKGAATNFKEAGPFAGSREQATERTVLLAMLQRLPADSNADLGRAFQALGRHDTAGAIRGLAATAATLPAAEGRGDVLVLAGQWAARQGNDTTARRLLTAAVAADSLGPAAPGAELSLAELEARRGEPAAAMRRLEHLILTYGESAVVPQARRLLDQLRGAVPKS